MTIITEYNAIVKLIHITVSMLESLQNMSITYTLCLILYRRGCTKNMLASIAQGECTRDKSRAYQGDCMGIMQ